MASYFRKSRNVELSTLYYLETSFNSDWSDINLVKTFKEAAGKNLDLPIVCVRLSRTEPERRELGATTLIKVHTIAIDIFATSDAQRLDLADYITDKLALGWEYYLHSHASGSKTTLERIQDGRLFIEDFLDDSKIDFGEEADQKEKYRHSIVVRVRK